MPQGLEEGDYYYSEEGYLVFTKQYHLKEDIVAKMVASIAPMALTKNWSL